MSAELRGNARNTWTGILLEFGHLIPHYPGVDVIKPAKIPPPPQLIGEDVDEWALQLLRAYHSTISHFYRSSAFTKARFDYRKLTVEDAINHRNIRALRESALFMKNVATQPFVWCQYSVRSWSKYGPPKYRQSPPTVTWVYGPKRLAQRDQWFQWQGETLQGSRTIMSKHQLRLIKLYDQLRAALIAAAMEPGLTGSEVSSIVRRLLPRGTYCRLVADAQADSEDIQSDIDRAMRRGDFIWDQ